MPRSINIEIGRSFMHRSLPRRSQVSISIRIEMDGRAAVRIRKPPRGRWSNHFLCPFRFFLYFISLWILRRLEILLSGRLECCARSNFPMDFWIGLWIFFWLFFPFFFRCADTVRFFRGGALQLTTGQRANSLLMTCKMSERAGWLLGWNVRRYVQNDSFVIFHLSNLKD